MIVLSQKKKNFLAEISKIYYISFYWNQNFIYYV